MDKLSITPPAIKRASRDVNNMAEIVRGTAGEDEARASNDSLPGADLGALSERAAETLTKSGAAFAKRLDSHSEALAQAGNTLESQDANAAHSFHRTQPKGEVPGSFLCCLASRTSPPAATLLDVAAANGGLRPRIRCSSS